MEFEEAVLDKEEETKLSRCHYCGAEGEYGKDLIDTDHLDSTGHNSLVTACKDVNKCQERQYDQAHVLPSLR